MYDNIHVLCARSVQMLPQAAGTRQKMFGVYLGLLSLHLRKELLHAIQMKLRIISSG